MSHMLTQDDLRAIGELLDEKVPALVKPLIKAGVDEIVFGVGQVIDESILPRFDKIDRRFDTVEKRLDTVENRLEGIDRRLDGVDKRLLNLEPKPVY